MLKLHHTEGMRKFDELHSNALYPTVLFFYQFTSISDIKFISRLHCSRFNCRWIQEHTHYCGLCPQKSITDIQNIRICIMHLG